MNEKLMLDFKYFLENEKRFSKHTIRSYEYDLNKFNNFLLMKNENLTFFDIDRSVIQLHIKNLSIKIHGQQWAGCKMEEETIHSFRMCSKTLYGPLK